MAEDMDPLATVLDWAARHSEIVGVLFGGSRAKGTHIATSDYDISVSLEADPSPGLVERLCADLTFENPLPAKPLAQTKRHFLIIGKFYQPKNSPEISMGFVNILPFQESLKNQANHPLVTEMFEFIKHSQIIYDPKAIFKDIKEKADVAWAYKKVLEEHKNLGWWSYNKYQKAIGSDVVTASFVRNEVLWHIVQTVAIINKYPLGVPTDYPNLKKLASGQGEKFIAPNGFFTRIEYLILNHDPEKLKGLLEQINALAEEFLKG